MVTSNKPKQEQSGSLALYVDLTTWEFPAIGRHYNPANLVSLVLKGLIFYLALSHLLRDPSSVTPTTFDTEEDLTAPNSSNAWISPTNEPYFQDHAIAQTACLLAFNALGNTLSPSFTLLMSTACWLPETVASDQPTSLPSSQPTSFSDTQFLVNTNTVTNQDNPRIAELVDGGWVIVWMSSLDGSSYGVYARRYWASGMPNGAEFRVNTYTTNDQSYPVVSALQDGGFIIIWQSYGQDNGDGWGIYAQRYTADGLASGAEFRVNTHINSSQRQPAVALLKNGEFIVTWESYLQDGSDYGIYGQRYTANATPVGTEFRINTNTASEQTSSAVASLEDGGFFTAWTTQGQDGSSYGVYAKRYFANGTVLNDDFRVNTYITSEQSSPAVAGLEGGSYVATWISLEEDGSNYGVYAKHYFVNGTVFVDEFRVNTYTIGAQSGPAIAALKGGGYIVLWQSYQQSSSDWSVYGQRYTAMSIKNGAEFRINTYVDTTVFGMQSTPDVIGLADGGFVATWQVRDQAITNWDIYGQRYDSNGRKLGILYPTSQPTGQPSNIPTKPSGQPSSDPSSKPSRRPSLRPVANPSSLPSLRPQANPTGQPSLRPEADPTGQPSLGPSSKPSRRPSLRPISNPSSLPSLRPQAKPTEQPSQPPSEKPSTEASAAFLSMFNKTLVPQGLHNVCFLDKRMMTFVHDTYWEFKWNGQLAASISLPYTVTSFTHDGNHSLIVAGVQVNGSSIVSMFDVNIRLETWIQNIPLSTINTLVFEASSQTLFISGIDSNQQLAILNMAMNQSNVNGVSYALSYNSLQPSFSTPTNPADRGMMLSVRALPSLENRVMMVNTMGKAKYIAAISLRNYILQSNAIVAMANNPKSPSSRNIALVGKAIGVNQDNLFYATIVNRLPISATSISISGLRCTAFSEFTDVVLDPSSPDRRILAVGISAGFAPNITQFNSIVIVSLLDFTIDAIRIQLAAGDSVSHCDMNTLSFGFLVQCLVTTAQYQQQTVLLVVTSTLMVPLLPAEYRVFKDVRFSYIDFTATQTTMQAFPWMASSSPSGSPSAGPFAVEPSNAPTDAQSAWSSHSPSALPTNIPSTSVMPTTLYHPSSHPSASQKPSARSPTTVHPTTVKPSTIKPISALPTTWKPSTQKPNTGNPVTALPSSNKPTTRRPTTRHPTTLAPNSAPPSTMPSTIDISNIPTNSMEEEPSPSPTRAPSVSHQTSDSSNLFLGAIIILGVIFGCGVLCFLYESLSLINDKKKIKPERPDAPKLDALGEEKKEEEIKESESITQESAPIIDNDNASKHSHGGSSDKHSRQLSSRHKSRFFMSSDNLSSISYASAPESSCMSGAYSPRFLMFSADQSDNRSQDSLSVHEKKRSHSGLTEKSPEHSSDDLSVNFDLYGTDQLDRLMSEEDFVIDAYVDSF